MEVAGLITTTIQTIRALLDSRLLIDYIGSIPDYKTHLVELQSTISKINAELAEGRHELSEKEQLHIDALKDVLYEADDILDEFRTLAEQGKLAQGFLKTAVSLFSKFGFTLGIARRIEKIANKLDTIARDNQALSFIKNPKPSIIRRPNETGPFVVPNDIIGRENDLENIVGMLLEPSVDRDTSFLAIVGIGGLGKTTLAQLVYNDPRITSVFSLKMWTCVSDLDQSELDVNGVLRKIWTAATDGNNEGIPISIIQTQVREKVRRCRYLIVLDDVWTEKSPEKWHKLKGFLNGGETGSWVVVTTRSLETARILDDATTYELKGLSDENSWLLFKWKALGSKLPSNHPKCDIGQQIVKRCYNTPLAIIVMGNLLNGKGIDYWQYISKVEVETVDAVLKYSYYHLEFPLRNCFSYCAIFPKNFEIEKKALTTLWMAHGYIIPYGNGPSIEIKAEEYFSILLKRCFFQAVKVDEFGETSSFRIQGLMHDLAREIARKEIRTMTTINGNMDKKLRHISLTSSKSTEYVFTRTSVRSFHHFSEELEVSQMDLRTVNELFSKWNRLRALDLSKLNIKSMPRSIDGLLHLRYLGLQYNEDLVELPDSVVDLYNLQTLSLSYCKKLKGLPKKMSKLVNLRVLDIKDCVGLTDMPKGMGKLSHLHDLSTFVVGESSTCWNEWLGQLEDLKELKSLQGFLEIKLNMSDMGDFVKQDDPKGGGYLKNKERLKYLRFSFFGKEFHRRVIYDKEVMEEMQVHSNLNGLEISGYRGDIMPTTWGNLTSLSNLVKVEIWGCPNLKYLGCLRNLSELRILRLKNLLNLECIEENSTMRLPTDVDDFFPALEELHLEDLPELKGLRELGDGNMSTTNSSGTRMAELRLSHLKTLNIQSCLNLTAILLCPVLENTTIFEINGQNLRVITSRDEIGEGIYRNVHDLLNGLNLVDNVMQMLRNINIF